jgi:hypothetical protein
MAHKKRSPGRERPEGSTEYEWRVGRFRYIWRNDWEFQDWQSFRRLEAFRHRRAARP